MFVGRQSRIYCELYDSAKFYEHYTHIGRFVFVFVKISNQNID